MLAIKNLVSEKNIFCRESNLTGVKVAISVVCNDSSFAEESLTAAFAEFTRVERLLNVFNEEGPLTGINRNAGKSAVKVTPEVFRLICRAVEISSLTSGAFDIVYTAPVKEPAGNNSRALVKPPKQLNFQQIILDNKQQTVFPKHKAARINLSNVVKGYAADRARYILQMNGIDSGVINAGGNFLTWGYTQDNKEWTVAATDPSQQSSVFANLPVSNLAFTAWVNSEAGKKPANGLLINPVCADKGFNVSAIRSLNVLSTSAELAAALTLPLAGAGINTALYMVNQLNQLGCIFIDDQERVYPSRGINI